jgi:hypothetical protein
MSDDKERESSDFGERISGWHASLGWGEGTESVAPYVPSPQNVVEEMLTVAHAGPGDILYDLGCGDGRILMTAIEKFNVDRAVGFELNPKLFESTRTKIIDKGLNDKIKIYNENFFKADLTNATIVTLYLTTSGNSKLRPKFIKELKNGTRIVSHDFPMMDWVTAKEDHGFYTLGSHKIFLYVVPKAFTEENPRVEGPNDESRWDRLKRLFDRTDRV